jgi:hypothetical protein
VALGQVHSSLGRGGGIEGGVEVRGVLFGVGCVCGGGGKGQLVHREGLTNRIRHTGLMKGQQPRCVRRVRRQGALHGVTARTTTSGPLETTCRTPQTPKNTPDAPAWCPYRDDIIDVLSLDRHPRLLMMPEQQEAHHTRHSCLQGLRSATQWQQ